MQSTRQYVEGLATGLSEQTGIGFQSGKQWMFDIKKNILHYNADDLKSMPALVSKGLILHETGHAKYTRQEKPTELEKKYPGLHNVYNALEDIRIEHKLRKEYGDFASQAIGKLNGYGIKYVLDQVKQKKIPNPLVEATLSTLIYLDACERENRLYNRESSDLRSSAVDIYQNISEEAQRAVHAISEGRWSNFEELGNKIKSCKTLGDLTNLVDTEIVPKIQPLLDKYGKDDPPEQGIAGQIKAGGCGATENQADELDDLIPTDTELSQLMGPVAHTLSQKLANILHESTATRYTGQHLAGKLLAKNVYKVATSENRIMSRRTNPNTPNYHFIVALDESGSMQSDGRHAYTYEGAFLLQEVCKRLRFPITWIKFDHHCAVMPNLTDYRRPTYGGNHDLDACNLALKQARKGIDNIILVLTDGGVDQNPTEAIEKIKKANIPIIAIGIGKEVKSELERFYPQSIACDTVSELPNKIVRLLSGLVHR